MTGIVFWSTSEHNRTDAIQLEYSYMKYNDVVKQKGIYDWTAMDRLLEAVARRGHQAIVRFYFVYPGRETTVPDYIKALPDYRETRGKSEGRPTGFCDWSHPELKRFTLEFYEELAAAIRSRPPPGLPRDGLRPLGRVSHLRRADGAGQDVPGQGVPGRVREAPGPGLREDALDDLGRRGRRRQGTVRRECRAPEAPVRRVRRLVPLPPAQARSTS